MPLQTLRLLLISLLHCYQRANKQYFYLALDKHRKTGDVLQKGLQKMQMRQVMGKMWWEGRCVFRNGMMVLGLTV